MRESHVPADKDAPLERHARAVAWIIVTCTETPNGLWLEPEAVDAQHAERGLARDETWRRRQNPHLKAFGWHFLIQPNGGLHSGRHLDEPGQHTRGRNFDSVAVALVGFDRYTAAAWDMLRRNVAALAREFPAAKVVGKDHFSPCLRPGFNVERWHRAGMFPPRDGILAPVPQAVAA